ncbi:MAG: M48 family metallopeptidase [Bacteroidota bacterium]
MTKRKRIERLYSVEYEHPFDRRALDRLENTRGLDLLTRKVLDYGLEKYLRIKHTGDNLQVLPENLPEIHNVLAEACEIMGMRTIPELYIMLEDKIQSFTSGDKERVIVISSGAVELLNSDELLFLLGRELGHIKSNHVLYHMMAYSIKLVAQIISDVSLGLGNLLSMPLQVALMYWHRMAEFTADRAGLLTCQDIDTASQCLIKMAGLPKQFYGRISTEDLRRQSESFTEIQESNFDKLIRFAAGYENNQPFTIIRSGQLFKWYDSGAFRRVLNREHPGGSFIALSCYNCGAEIAENYKFCKKCGVKLKEDTVQDTGAVEAPSTVSSSSKGENSAKE